MLTLLESCPHEVAHLRKELLIAAKHILATDQRSKFVSQMEKLFDENTLVGSGWTTQVRRMGWNLLHGLRVLLILSVNVSILLVAGATI